MDLIDYREKIDSIDSQLVELFKERMSVAKDIAQYKKENHINVYDAAREREKINAVRDQSGDELSSFASVLYT
ncbi:MAG: chorismate mutase, partial [Firmicutes bacterium]|nr:chorismate mutase [Bacillota bacterium]